MIVDTRKLERERDWLSKLLKQSAHVSLNSIEAFNLLIIVHEHIAVDLMNENLIPDIRLDLARFLDNLEELLTGAFIICIMSIYNID